MGSRQYGEVVLARQAGCLQAEERMRVLEGKDIKHATCCQLCFIWRK